jgi:hypothetical protein
MTEDKTLWLDRALDIAVEAIANGSTVECMVVSRALVRLENRVETLFEAIAHGDEKHRDWLNDKINEHIHS